MNIYGQLFKKHLISESKKCKCKDKSKCKGKKIMTEADMPPVNVSPEEHPDTGAWKRGNEDIANNPELSSKFDVEGIPPEITGQYIEKIKTWNEEVKQMSTTLEQIYDFATQNAEKPGADNIFNEVSKDVETLLAGVGTLEGKLKFLGKKVNVLISRDAKKQRGLK